MSDKKHIDRLFQEKLKDFEATPNDAVWNNINSQLKKDKDDRKVIPIWWKLAGVAAALLLFLTVGNLIFNDSNSIEVPTIVEIDEKVDNNNNEQNNNNSVADSNDKNDKNSNELNNDSLSNKKSIIQQNDESIKSTNVANSSQSDANIDPTKLASKDQKHNQKQTPKNKQVITQQNNLTETENITIKDNLNVIDDKADNPTVKTNSIKEALVENQMNNQNLSEKNKSKDPINNEVEKTIVDIEKDKIPLTEDVITSNEDIIEEEKESINRWQVNPNIAPVYFNSFGKGSAIHEQLVNNEKSGEINMSYGVNVSYAVNNKLSVKSGVNRFNLGYSTNDIIVYDNVSGSMANTDLFRNIDLGERLPQASFLSGTNLSLGESPSIIPGESTALLKQDMTYYEIPLEVKYKLSDNKFGVSLLGGFSTFVLSDNNVSYELKGENTELGEAANLNDISYSANFGFGLNYNISKNVNVNLDPMFKYQINTFTNTSGDFQPYFIGVYSGIHLKF